MAQAETADLLRTLIEKGIIASDVSISPAVRPDIVEAVMKSLFAIEVIDSIQQFCVDVEAADKAERSKVKVKPVK